MDIQRSVKTSAATFVRDLRPARWSRAVLAAGLAAVVLAVAVLAPIVGGRTDQSGSATVGRSEAVVITAADNPRQFETVARVDTGADRTSVDLAVVEALGLDLTDAPTVQVSSALGTERRPLVDLDLTFAGRTQTIEASVADRSGRSTVVLIGVDALDGFLVDPVRTTPTVAEVVPQTSTPSASDVSSALLLLLPLAAAVVVGLRTVAGLQPLGIFAPALLALAVIHGGGTFLYLFAIALAATAALLPIVARLHLPRHARLAFLVGAIVLVWLQALGGSVEQLGTAFGVPVIVTVVVLDRLWAVVADAGGSAALRAVMHTTFGAIAVWGLLSNPTAQSLALRYPVAVLVAGSAGAVLAGRYRGLRLTEFRRFERPRDPSLESELIDLTAVGVGEPSSTPEPAHAA